MSLIIEKWLPRTAGVLVASMWFILKGFYFCPALEWSIDKVPPHLLLGTVTFGAIMAGFFGISMSILSTSSELMDAIKKVFYDKLLVDYIIEFISSAVVLAIISLLFLFAFYMPYITASKIFPIIVSGVWLGLMTWAILCFIRLIRILTGIIKDR